MKDDNMSVSNYVIVDGTVTIDGVIPNYSNSLTFSMVAESAGQEINNIVHELKKEIGQLQSQVKILEEAVKEETAEKYAAYKRIAELTKNN